MDDRMLSRQTFLLQMTAGFAVLAVGCGDDGDGSSSTTGDDTDPTNASMSGSTSTTSGGSSSTSGGTSTTDPTSGSGSSGDNETSAGSESGSSTGSAEEGSTTSGSDSTGEANVCMRDVVVAQVSLNHGHALEIPMADIEAGVEVTYDASGTAGHCHAVTLTAEDFATLRGGGVVTKFSCNGGDHEFVISCVDGARPPGDPAADCAGDPNAGTCG